MIHEGVQQEIQEFMGVPFKEIQYKAIEVFLRRVLDEIKGDMFKIMNKHGVRDVREMDKWFEEGKIEEAGGWEDFFDLDRLEHKRRVLERILGQL